jgi:hypothetical protein
MIFNYFFNQISQEWRTRKRIIFSSSSGRIMIPQWHTSIVMGSSRSISKRKKISRSVSMINTYLYITCTAASSRTRSRYA